MSLDALRWAMATTAGSAAAKLVLISLADRADESCRCYPSSSRLASDTELDRKTVYRALSALKDAGLIRDTGQRVGPTKSVVVWQLVGVPDRVGAVPKTEQVSCTENGTPFEEAVPFFPPSCTKNGTGSCTKNGTQNLSGEPTREPKRLGSRTRSPKKPNEDRETRLPDDFAMPADWLAMAQTMRPDVDAKFEAEKFTDYWISATGARARKRNWQATWRNWVRNARATNAGNSHTDGRRLSAVERAEAAEQRFWQAERRRAAAGSDNQALDADDADLRPPLVVRDE